MKSSKIFTSLKNLNLSKDKLLLILLGGVLLIIISWPVKDDSGSKTDKDPGQTAETPSSAEYGFDEDYARALEEKIEDLLSKAEGVGKVQVMVTLKNAGEIILKSDVKTNGDTKEETVIYEKGSNGSLTPFVTDRIVPQVSGVLIIAEGADNARIIADIIEAVEAVLGIGSNKIKVMKMEG